MSGVDLGAGPVKAWIEPDRWALLRAFPLKTLLLLLSAVVSAALGYALHPVFFVMCALSLLRHAAAQASLRELFRDGMLHPAIVLQGARGRIATLVRLDEDGRTQDAVVISRIPRRWTRRAPPWGGERAAMVIAGNPPRLKPLSPDVAIRDLSRAQRATERIPDAQWRALTTALAQLADRSEGVHPVELGEAPWYGSVRDLEIEGSLPAHLDREDEHVFCAGLPSVEEPPMAAAEKRRVERLRRRTALDALGRVLILLGVPGVLARETLPEPLRASMWMVLLVAAPLLLASIGSAVLRVRAYGRDLKQGTVWRFAGVLSAFDSLALDRDLALLARRGMLAPEPGVEQDLVVLKDARELLHANGKWAPHGVTLHVSELAVPPSDPVKLALPRELRTDGSQVLDLGRRRLTQAELRELSRHALHLRKPGRALFWLTPLVLAVLLVWGEHRWALPPHLTGAPLVLGMWLVALQAFWRRLRLAGRLREDAQLGWVVTVDHLGDAARSDPELPARGIESLLHARLDWTVNRRPATWRRFAE